MIGKLESEFVTNLRGSYSAWIEYILQNYYLECYRKSSLEITQDIKNYFNPLRIREHLKEVLLGHFYNHNCDVERVLMKSWQYDYYSDAAVSTIKHLMGPNVGMYCFSLIP